MDDMLHVNDQKGGDMGSCFNNRNSSGPQKIVVATDKGFWLT